jgi:hypothetical protein
MLVKSKNSVLDMFVAVHHLYTNVQSNSTKELGIEVVGHSLVIEDTPLRTSLHYQVGRESDIIVIQKYAHADDDHQLLEKKQFSLRDMPGVEDYIIEAFEL